MEIAKKQRGTIGKRPPGSSESVKKRIQRIVILVVASSMLILGTLSCVLNYYSTISSLKTSMQEMAEIAASRVEWQITSYKNIVQELGRMPRLTNDDYSIEEKQQLIDEKVESYNCIRGKLIDVNGIAQIDGTDYNEREYFRRALAGETYISEPLIAKTDGNISLIFAAPVWKDGIAGSQIEGVVFLSMQPDLLNDIVKSINISPNSGAYIINNAGTTVAHTTDDMVTQQNNTIENAKTDSSLNAIAAVEKKMIAGESGFGTYRYNGAFKFLAYAPIGNTDSWSLGINAPASDFLGDTILGIVLTVMIAIIFIVIASYLAFKAGNSIGNPIRQCAERLNLVLQGDLQSPVPEVNTKDEVGILSNATKGITEGLNQIIGDIGYLLTSMADGDFTVTSRASGQYIGDYEKIHTSMNEIKQVLGSTLASVQEASEQVSTGAGQLADNAQSLAEAATEQSGAVEELSSSIENAFQIAKVSAANARQAYIQVDDAVVKAKSGGQAMIDLTEAMSSINSTSQEIQNIITAIEDIASQTNLLSLNASIEAARAGEAGRGFAVVAEQIGKLASDSAQSAVNTRDLIIKVLEEINHGTQIANNTSEIFTTVVEDMGGIAEMAHGASDASDQQAELLEQLEKGVQQISGTVQSNSASAEETSATSEELSAQSETMNQLIAKFVISS